MARLWFDGFENNTTTVKAWDSNVGAGSTVQTVTVRSGTYALKQTSLVSATQQGIVNQFSLSANGPFFIRFYFQATAFPTAENQMFTLVNGALVSATAALALSVDNLGALRLYNATTLVGGASPVMVTGQWYCIEVWYDKSPAAGSQVMKARLNGYEWVSSSSLTIANQVQSVVFGANLNAEAQTTGTWFFDDIAINDSTGTSQLTYPGPGKVVHQLATGAGANTTWAIFAGSTNWSAIGNLGAVAPTITPEITPDGNTSALQSLTVGQIDDYATTVNAGISTFDTINVVALAVYYEGVGASANAQFVLRLRNSATGTPDESGAIDPTSTGYVTNNKTSPRNFRFVRYFQQDGITPWNQPALATAQFGIHLTVTSTNRARVSAVWLVIDYTPEVSARGITDIQNSLSQNVNQAGNRAGVM